ncbi:MAG: helix-turn-helix domain-containing protein [Candidatus Helarchaeota archaeon]
MTDEIFEGKIIIELPRDKWISELSRKFSNYSFHISSMSLINQSICNVLVEIRGDKFSNLLKELKSHTSVSESSTISVSSSSILVNVKTQEPMLLSLFNKKEIIIKYPIIVNDGWAEWDFFASRERITSLFEELQEKGLNIELKSIGKPKINNILTDRQLEILEIALRNGYFEIPRRISLNNLARKLNIAPSTLSETLRRIHKKVLLTQ